MRISTLSVQPIRRRNLDLMVGTALGCSLLVIANPAAAQNECGPAVGGVVTCAAAGSPYATGIQYTPPAGGLTMNIEAGTNVDSVGAGVRFNASAGPVTLNARDTTIRATLGGAPIEPGVIRAYAAGDITIHAGTVEGSGGHHGIVALLGGAPSGKKIEVTADSVTVAGDGANGLAVYNDSGDVDVVVGTINATGEGSIAVWGHSLPANATVDVDTIVVSGVEARGVELRAHDVAAVHVGSLTSSGDRGLGIMVSGGTLSQVEFGSIATDGYDAAGIYVGADRGEVLIRGGSLAALGGGDEYGAAIRVAQQDPPAPGSNTVTVEVETIVTGKVAGGVHSGDNGHGLQVDGIADVNFDIGAITTHGQNAQGVTIGTQGQITGTVGTVETWGDSAIGLNLVAVGGITADFNSITTHGRSARGVQASADTGDIDITGGDIETTGAGSSGIVVENGGAATLDLGTVSTRGHYARGIDILRDPELSGPAQVVVTVDAVHTGYVEADGTVTGFEADAIRIVNAGDTTVTVGTVTTLGGAADAISIDALGTGHVTVTATGAISTNSGSGIDIDGADGAVVRVADVLTRESNSDAIAIDAYEDDGEMTGGVTLVAGDISTLDNNSRGVVVDAAGDVFITTGDISTEGDTSVALRGSSARGSLRMEVGDIHTDGVASGGLGAHAFGDVTVTAGDIEILSSSAEAVVVGSETGNVTLTVGDVVTEGHSDSDAITVSMGAAAGILHLTAGAVEARDTPGYQSAPGNSAIVVSNGGLSDIDIASALTNSINAAAIHIDGKGTGEVDVHVTGSVVSTNARSGGVRVLNATDVDIRAAEVRTTGEDSAGVKIGMAGGEVTGDIAIGIEQIRTTGDRSHGLDIATSGDVAVSSQLVSTTGAGARAILVDADDRVALFVGSAIASAADGVAVEASGRTLDLTVATELRGTRVGADLTAAETLAVTLGAGSSTTGSVFGLDLSSGTGTTVTNRGSLSSTEGVALNVDGGAATISNIGNLAGRIDLTEAADRLTNSGTFRLRGESDFGGASDALDNTGMVTFAESTTPLLARLRNLERFNNGGTIDLSNGVAGDVLTIDGALNGQAGNRVLLDLDARTATVLADRLVVGSLEGVTNLQLEVLGAGVIGDTGVTLVSSGIAQTGQELLVTTTGGFLEYNAVFDAASREYRIVGLAADRAWEPTKVASGAQMQWRRGADVISARFDELRDSGAMGLRQGGGVEAWAQAFGGVSEVDGQRVIDDEAADLSHDVDVAGGQVGVDIVRGFGGGDIILGLTGSVSETELEFQSNGDTATFSGFGIGAYAQWSRGPLAIGVLAKGDTYDLEYDWVSADLSDEADGSTFGVRVDAAWRIDAGSGWIIEPQASTWWTETNLDSISAEAGEVEFGDTTSLIGRAGVRVAHGMSLPGGAMIQPFVGVYGYNEFEGDNASRIHIGSQTLDVADAAADLWGEAVFGANVGDGLIQGFVQGEAAFGEISGFTARVGVRMNW